MTLSAELPLADPPNTSSSPHVVRPERGVAFLARTVMPYTLLTGVLLVFVRWASTPVSNFDTFFHLRFGHEFLHGWSLRHPGHVTSYATADWVPTEWLPEVVMAKMEDWFGLAGVAWLGGLQYVALCVALVLAGRRVANVAICAPLLIITIIGCVSGLSIRPQMISYVLVVVTAAVWRGVTATSRPPWLLVPVTWVWAMCHGMWPLGVVIGLVAVAGLALDGAPRGRVLRLAAVPLAGGVAGAALTPVGPALLPAVVTVTGRGRYFTEWGPPVFTHPQEIAVLLLLSAAVGIMTRRGGNSWSTMLMVGLGAACAVYSMRTVPVAACLLMPLAAEQLQRLAPTFARLGRAETRGILAGAIAGLAILAVVVPHTASRPPPQPTWVDPALHALPAGTRILNDDLYGGYLMWRYPDLDFMFSGYGDIYTIKELQASRTIGALKPGWVDLVRAAHPSYALVSRQAPLAWELRHEEGWLVVHQSEDVLMLEPPTGWYDAG